MQKITCFDLFKVFFKIGLILLGGGYVIVPIMQDKLVEKRNWINKDELINYYCISQCLPGIIAVNMSILIGYKLLKLKGAIISLFAMSLSPFVIIVSIAGLLDKIAHIPCIQGVFFGVNIAVIILIYLTLKEMWKKSMVDLFSTFWFLVVLILSLLKVSPVILIIVSIIFGILIEFIRRKKNA